MYYYTLNDVYKACEHNQQFAIAHLNSEEPVSPSPHSHKHHELYYSLSGGKQFCINGETYDIIPGDIFFIAKDIVHSITNFDASSHERLSISIQPEYLEKISSEHTSLTSCFSGKYFKIHLDLDSQQRFIHLFNKIANVSGFGSDILELAYFAELMIFVNYEFLKNFAADFFITNSRLQPVNAQSPLFSDILNYINSNLSTDISLEDLSQRFFVSKSYICRLFKRHTNKTVKGYITERRISIAKSLLANGIRPQEVSEHLGFANYNTFYKTFCQHTGVSPQNYRNFQEMNIS